MQFFSSVRQQTSIVRDARLGKITAAEHKMPNNEQKWRQLNEQTTQDKSKIYKYFKLNLHYNQKANTEIDCISTGLEMEANMVASAKEHR